MNTAQGGATTDLSMPMTKPGQHLRVTDEATVALVRRLAEHYDDRTIAAILARRPSRPSRVTVNISSSPSRSDAAARG